MSLWNDTDSTVRDVLSPQKALAKAIHTRTNDWDMTADLLDIIGRHIVHTASTQMLSRQYEEYGRNLAFVAKQTRLTHHIDSDGTPVSAGVIR